ncbi:MAG: hypothetical protein ACFBSE_16565 [Prochloraceae cyanobacterium]
MIGEGGNDFLTGSGLAQLLDGGTGNDILEGLNGNDTLFGGEGLDTLIGNAGNDTAVFSELSSSYNFQYNTNNIGFDSVNSIEQVIFEGDNKSVLISKPDLTM